MHKHLLAAAALVAAHSLQFNAFAAEVYRCGSSYSQTPCSRENSQRVLQVDDARTADQAAISRAETESTARLANEMEQSRLKQEALDQRRIHDEQANARALAKAAELKQKKVKPNEEKKKVIAYAALNDQAKKKPKKKKPRNSGASVLQ